MINETAALKPGERGEFALVRDGKEIRVTVTVGSRPQLPREAPGAPRGR
jgi:S1-C subfamily serine protease